MAETKSLAEVMKSISKKYGENIVRQGAEALECDGILSLGSPTVDFCLYGGIPEGRIIEFSGAEGGGKTTTAFLVAASYQKEELKRNPENPRKIVFLDNEGTLDPTWASVFNYDLSEDAVVPTIVLRPEGQSAEVIFDMALDMLRTGEVGLLIFDSIATLVPAQISDASMEQYQMGGIAKSLTRFANTALGLLRKYKATLIAINQVRENMSMYGNPLTTPGGRAWKHACSSRLMFKRGDFFDEDGNKLSTSAESPAGHIVNVAVLKTKTSKWDRKVGSYRLNYTKGVDVLSDTLEVALHFGFIDNSTQGTFKLVDPDTGELLHDEDGNEIKIRGKANLTKYFNEHLDEWRKLYDRIYEKIRQKECPYVKSFEEMLGLSLEEDFGLDGVNMDQLGDL
jgi:recombination protein RecA